MEKTQMKKLITICLVMTIILAVSGVAQAALWDWSVYYTHTQTGPPNNWASIRGIALAKDGSDLYWGHTSPARADSSAGLTNDTLNIVRLDRTSTNVLSHIVSSQPKALATDDRGFVYTITGGFDQKNTVYVYDAGLVGLVNPGFLAGDSINTKYAIEGLEVLKSGSAYSLYTANRSTGMVYKVDVTDIMNPGTPVLFCDLPSTNARGLTLDSTGAVWVADYSGKVYKIAADGLTYASVTVPSSTGDVSIYGDLAYVSTYSTVEVLNVADMSLVRSLTNPYGTEYGLGGLDMSADGQILYVANGNAYSTIIGEGPNYTWTDRILTIQTPEPATIGLLGLGALSLLKKRRT
jgi:hypothetical protein